SKSNINIIIRKILNRFIGAEIISQTSNKTEIECFLHDDEQKLEKIEKRIFFLIKETISELLINIENKTFSNFNENVYEYHDNITKFINYYLRMLDSSNKSESEKKIAYTFYETIDIIIDKIRHISEKINKHGSSKNINIYIEKMFNLLFDMFTSLHKEKLSKELISKRYELVKKFENEKFESKDIYILSDIKIIFDIINKFSQYIIIKNLEK
ncbi:MAG: hypothetical protein KC550_02570, partial [Nanoarchaeota archaeon]|nr:hypothetical protein [Nanoarchaeota archaeon]